MITIFKDKHYYLIALSLFILAALYGLLMRLQTVFPTSLINYQNLLQGHSHVAFLGWGYIAVLVGIKQLFISNKKAKNPVYIICLALITISVGLMLFSFPLVGYKLFSIVLLAVFGLVSYVVSFKILKDIEGSSYAVKFIKYGIYYYLLSSLATWFLAYVLITQGKTDLYYNTIYFYLHFLYNGFFVFALFGLLFKVFEQKGIKVSLTYLKGFFSYLNIACIPAYALSVLWSTSTNFIYVIAFAAALLQLFSLLYLIKLMLPVVKSLAWKKLFKYLLYIVLVAYFLKVVIQVSSAFPVIVQASLALKPFLIVGYLHLFTLAFMSIFIFLILFNLKKLKINNLIAQVGIHTFIVGVFLSETLLLLQGLLLFVKLNPIPHYNLLLLISSFFVVLGIVLLFIGQFVRKSLLN